MTGIQVLVESYLRLPSKEAISLWESCDENTQERLKKELIDLHEMSVFNAINKISSRPGAVLDISQRDVNFVLKQLEDTRKFEDDYELTLEQALRAELTIPRIRREFDSMKDWERTNFNRKLSALKKMF